MGIYVKNRKTPSGSSSVVIPAGGSAQRPTHPVFGQIRFNIDSGKIEVFEGSVFRTLSYDGVVPLVVDSFTGDASTVVFGPMSYQVSQAEQIIVFVGSVYQIPQTNYTVAGNFDITFAAAPPNNTPINIIHNLGGIVE